MSRPVAALLADAIARLRDAGVEDAARDARRLLAHALGQPPGAPPPDPSWCPDAAAAQRFEAAIVRRVRRQPVAQITGRRAFWGRDFAVTPEVLDPRPETEQIVELALAGPAPAQVIDLGTGSGALIVTLLAEWPEVRGTATDISPGALAVARENAVRHGVADRLTLLAADWWQGVDGRFGLVVSNPPYIPEAELATLAPEVRDWEPRAALSPGPDGLAAYRAIVAGLAGHLEPGGRVLVEHGAGQEDGVAKIFAAAGFAGATSHRDLSGHGRIMVVATD